MGMQEEPLVPGQSALTEAEFQAEREALRFLGSHPAECSTQRSAAGGVRVGRRACWSPPTGRGGFKAEWVWGEVSTVLPSQDTGSRDQPGIVTLSAAGQGLAGCLLGVK